LAALAIVGSERPSMDHPAGVVAMVDTIRHVAPPSVLRASIERYLGSPLR